MGDTGYIQSQLLQYVTSLILSYLLGKKMGIMLALISQIVNAQWKVAFINTVHLGF